MNERYLRPTGADLFRVLAVGMVGVFHFWQQSWVCPPALDFLARSGGAWVDGMILLSAFCLYLPYAHAWAQRKPFPGCRGFLRRRAVRLLPSYYFAVLVSALVWAAGHRPDRDFWLDVGSHLLLIPTLVPQGYVYCRTNGALWTVGVLVLFYLLFPLLARAFYAWPLPVLAGLCAAQELYARCRVLPLQGVDYSMRFNQLPAFFGVIGLGFAAAQAVALLAPRQTKHREAFFALAALTGLGSALWVLRRIAYWQDGPHGQLVWRLPLALCFAVCLLGLCLGPQLPGARLWALFGGLSYNFYIWHQWLAVRIKYDLHIPPWQGDTPPNQLGDTGWMHTYLALVWAVGLTAAVLATYGLEKPAARWLRARLGTGRSRRAESCTTAV